MKVLILSCSTGEGHNSAAKAYKDYLESLGIDAEFRDVLCFVDKTLPSKVSKIYNHTLDFRLFGLVYKVGTIVNDCTIGMISPVYWANAMYSKKLGEYINENHFDAIVCTHIFASDSVSVLQKKKVISIPTMHIMTDYTAIPFTKDSDLDWYVAPHKDIIDFCVKKGLKREKILPLGIPVRREFYSKYLQN